jgi:hypothetical protein
MHDSAASAVGVGAVGVLVGFASGIAVALLANPRSSWLSYLAAHSYLAARGRMPWRLMRFLDDAHERGVLRRAGGLYQFRHARLQDHLAGGTVPAARARSRVREPGRYAQRRPSAD